MGKNIEVGFVGKMASGKSVSAQHIISKYGGEILSFAGPLKQIVAEIDTRKPWHLINEYVQQYIEPTLTEQEYDNLVQIIEETKNIPHEVPKPRKRLQFLGTDGGRKQVRETIWVDTLVGKIPTLRWTDMNFAVEDVRFRNEVKTLETHGVTVIKLNVSPEMQKERLLNLYGTINEKALQHQSETEIDTINTQYEIDADQPLESMLLKIDNILE